MKNQSLSLRLIYILVFFAGFSVLIYEVSWFRMLALALGATVKSSTFVLMAFMAGFGSGAWFWGKSAQKSQKKAEILSLLFLISAITGILFYFFLAKELPAIRGFVHQIFNNLVIADISVWVITLILLFIPAFTLGGAIPITSALIIRSNEETPSGIGRIYSFETLGSTLGGLATGFLLIRYLGQQNTIWVAVMLNLISSIVFYAFRHSCHYVPVPAAPPESHNRSSKKVSQSENKNLQIINRQSALVASFITGLSVLGLQILWFRIFRVYLTNTSYTFSLIASVVILGLFAGSRYFASRKNDQLSYPALSKMLFGASLLTVAGFFILTNIPEILIFPLAGNEESYLMRIIVIPVLSAILVIFPVTFVSGYLFPLACSLYSREFGSISRDIGRVMLYNTLGSVAGPAISAFLLIPAFGAGKSVLVFASLLSIASYYIVFKGKKAVSDKFSVLIPATATIILVAFVALLPVQRILPPSFSRFDREVLEYHETTEGTWVVGREQGGRNTALSTYVNNSAVIGSSYDAIKVVKMVGHLPFYSGIKCNDVLVVGFGIGVTTSAIASHAEVKHIDCIELVDGLKSAAHHYSGLNNNIQNDKRLRVIPGDGRHYLQSTTKKYDLISSDPTHPILGSGSLYTKEYFELCKSRLNPGGMVSQYLPLHKLLPDDFKGIIKTFHSVFPNSTVWLGQNHAVLLGSLNPIKIDFQAWSDKVESTGKDPYFYNNPYHLAACLVVDSHAISEFPANIRINTDNHPLTEFFRFSSFKNDNIIHNLKFLDENRCNVFETFTNIADTAAMNRFVAGNSLLAKGSAADLKGNRREFINKLREAISANPENEEYPFLIRFYGGSVR